MLYTTGSLLFYQCDTESGSSGSPVFKVTDNTMKVVAVHRGERSAKKGISGVNIGSRVSSILDHIKTGKLGHSKTTLEMSPYIICDLFYVVPTPEEVKLLEEVKLKKLITRAHLEGI